MCRLILMPLLATFLAISPGQEPSQSSPGPENDQPATVTDTQPADSRGRQRNPTQARVFEELLRENEQTRGRPILSEESKTAEIEEAEGEGRGGLVTEGSILIERLGRLVDRKGVSEFHFNPGAVGKDVPGIMIFNKNKLLELMEKESATGVLEFIITAEVTRYRGQNYLNLLKYRRQIAHGNLSP